MIPSAATSTARARASPTIPAFAAAYATSPRIAITGPVTLVTITTRPHPAERIAGSAARLTRNAVSRLRRSDACQVSSDMSVAAPDWKSSSLVEIIPALLTSTSSRPW